MLFVRILLSLLLLLGVTSLRAQSAYRDYVKAQKEKTQQYQNKQQAAATGYLIALQEAWERYDAQRTNKPPRKEPDRPTVYPTAQPETPAPIQLPIVPDPLPPSITLPPPPPAPVAPPAPAPVRTDGKEVDVKLFDVSHRIFLPHAMRVVLSGADEAAVATAYDAMMKSPYSSLIQELLALKTRWQLSD